MRCLRRAGSLTLLLLAAAMPTQAQELVVCGWDEVYVLDLKGEPTKVWSWRAADRPELPEAYREKFRTTDECKPVAGHRFLITASSDGAALVDRETGVARWWGQCGNAHSAELLPRERIVLACSVREGTGNRLALFDAGVPGQELYSTELHSGHGAVWDAQRQILWAIGMDDLRAYTLVAWDTAAPSLALKATYPLPDRSGHELMAVPDSPLLVLSTHASVWVFDRETGVFSKDRDLQDLHDVKGVAIQRGTGRTAYVQADAPEWWSSRIRLLHPERTITLEGERIYQVRWVEQGRVRAEAR
jgi:hypothetical protein